MKEYLVLILLTFIVPAAISCGNSATQAQPGPLLLQESTIAKNVSAKEFQQLISARKSALLLDVRTAKEVAEGHIANTKHLDFYSPDFKDELAKLDKGKPVLIYCRSGRRSGITMSTMREMGFSEVYNLQGGIIEWREAGLEIER